MAYYYVGYLYKYFNYIIKKERRPQSMKITCNKNELTNALQIVARAVASKPQTPILSGIYLRAEGRPWNSRPQIMRLDSSHASKQRSRKQAS